MNLTWVTSNPRFDYSVNPNSAERFYPEIRKYYPNLKDGSLEPGYSGIRPKLSGPSQLPADFVIQVFSHSLIVSQPSCWQFPITWLEALLSMMLDSMLHFIHNIYVAVLSIWLNEFVNSKIQIILHIYMLNLICYIFIINEKDWHWCPTTMLYRSYNLFSFYVMGYYTCHRFCVFFFCHGILVSLFNFTIKPCV